MDFNRDGDWDDAGEQVFSSQAISAGENNLSVSIPSNATAGTTFARFRLTSTGGYDYAGLAPNGEVEDYQITIVSAFGSSGRSASAGGFLVGSLGAVESPAGKVSGPKDTSTDAVWASVEPSYWEAVEAALEAVAERLRPADRSEPTTEELVDSVFENEF